MEDHEPRHQPCGNCGKLIRRIHFCDLCDAHVCGVLCGVPVEGQEGFGAPLRRRACLFVLDTCRSTDCPLRRCKNVTACEERRAVPSSTASPPHPQPPSDSSDWESLLNDDNFCDLCDALLFDDLPFAAASPSEAAEVRTSVIVSFRVM